MYYKYMGNLSFTIGVITSISPIISSNIEYNLLQTVCFLLGFISYAVFEGLILLTKINDKELAPKIVNKSNNLTERTDESN